MLILTLNSDKICTAGWTEADLKGYFALPLRTDRYTGTVDVVDRTTTTGCIGEDLIITP